MPPTPLTPLQQIGRALRSARLSVGWTQQDLGDRLNVARQSVAGWEAGLVWPSPLNIEGIRRELGFDMPIEPPVTPSDVPAAPRRQVSPEMARGMRLAALKMSEVLAEILREAAIADEIPVDLPDHRHEVEATAARRQLAAQELSRSAGRAASGKGAGPRPRRR